MGWWDSVTRSMRRVAHPTLYRFSAPGRVTHRMRIPIRYKTKYISGRA
jgi:hypothetical protein